MLLNRLLEAYRRCIGRSADADLVPYFCQGICSLESFAPLQLDVNPCVLKPKANKTWWQLEASLCDIEIVDTTLEESFTNPVSRYCRAYRSGVRKAGLRPHPLPHFGPGGCVTELLELEGFGSITWREHLLPVGGIDNGMAYSFDMAIKLDHYAEDFFLRAARVGCGELDKRKWPLGLRQLVKLGEEAYEYFVVNSEKRRFVLRL